MAAKERYEKLRKKYKNLPEWDWLERNFEIKIKKGNILKQIKKSVAEKLVSDRDTIEPLISMTESYSSYFERRMITKKELDKLFQIYKKFQSLIWSSNIIEVDWSEKGCADWLADVKKILEREKEKLKRIFKKISSGWAKYKKPKIIPKYFG